MLLNNQISLKQYFPLAIIVLGIFLRFYQLETRTNFTADGGRDYAVVRQMIQTRKPTLLGPKASVGEFFFGPFYYYLLAPVLVIGNFDPLSGAVLTAFLDSISLILFYFLAKKLLPKANLIATSLYATFPLLISMVKIPLNPFVIPFFSVLFLFALHNTKYVILNPFGSGLLAGLLFQLHFATAPMIAVGLIAMMTKKEKLLSLGSYVCGLILGIFPMIIFDIRHQLFNSTRIIQYLAGGGGGKFSDHYFIVFFPIAFLLIAKISSYFPHKLVSLVTTGIIVINTWIYFQPVHNGYLMPVGWNLPGIRQTVAYIAADNPQGRFGVAAMLDGDTRAMPYRYLLEAKYSKIPLGVEEYPLAQTLYVITRESAEKIITNPVWEISSIQPTKVTQTWKLQNEVLLHKLEKI